MNVVRVFRTTAAFGLIALLNGACTTVSEAVSDATPYGVQLRERVEQWDRWCKAEKLGPYNTDPRRAHITTCDFLYLKDQRWDPNADEFSRYAHSIKLPPPHNQPQAQYRPGMTSKQYFEELCAKEAGQWIFRTVTGVEGVLQGRPVVDLPIGFDSLVFASAEVFPVGSNSGETWMSLAGGYLSAYDFFERRLAGQQYRFERHYQSQEAAEKLEPGLVANTAATGYGRVVPVVRSDRSLARYGYVGRGVSRKSFMDHAISGGELVVFDVQTLEVIALFRDFSIRRPSTLDSVRLTKEVLSYSCGSTSQFVDTVTFIPKVLKPIR